MKMLEKMKLAAESVMRPPLVISVLDYERLAALAEAMLGRSPEMAEELLRELDRALVVSQPEFLADVVRMNSTVLFRDEVTGKVQRLRLVYPGEADIESDRISVLTPVGTALIGLSKGQSISWRTRSDEPRSLTVLEVTPPAGGLTS